MDIVKKENHAEIGVLCWEGNPEGSSDELAQFEEIPGHFMHPDTFDFPLRFERVDGANFNTIVRNPSNKILNKMIKISQKLEEEGIKAITTSCGFNAIFQKELAEAVEIPVFSSSLLQVPIAYRMLGRDKCVGIITADKDSLTGKHLQAVGIDSSIPVSIAGVEDTESFSNVRENPKSDLDVKKFRSEVVEVARQLIEKEKGNVGAIVMECTDLPSFSGDINEMSGLPVFDIVTLTNWVYASIS